MIDMFKDIIKQRVHRNIFVKWRSNIQFTVQTLGNVELLAFIPPCVQSLRNTISSCAITH